MHPQLQDALQAWEQATGHLASIVQSIAPDQWSRPSPYPGWTNKDLLAHLATGYVQRLALLDFIIATGQPGPLPDTDIANAANVEARQGTSVEELLTEMVATRARVQRLMGQLKDEHLDITSEDDHGPVRLGAYLLDLSRHDIEHASDLLRS